MAKDKSKHLASQDLGAIRTLQRSEPFKLYWQRRVLDPLRSSAKKILYDRTLEGEDLWKEVLRFRLLEDISKTLVQDEASCLNVLDGAVLDEDA